jgi:hypothetical protein
VGKPFFFFFLAGAPVSLCARLLVCEALHGAAAAATSPAWRHFLPHTCAEAASRTACAGLGCPPPSACLCHPSVPERAAPRFPDIDAVGRALDGA